MNVNNTSISVHGAEHLLDQFATVASNDGRQQAEVIQEDERTTSVNQSVANSK